MEQCPFFGASYNVEGGKRSVPVDVSYNVEGENNNVPLGTSYNVEVKENVPLGTSCTKPAQGKKCVTLTFPTSEINIASVLPQFELM